MSVVRGSGLLSLINGFVDRAIGADGLEPRVRDKLLRQQLGSVSRMTPAVLAASVVVSGVFLMMTWQTSRFWPILFACSIIVLIAVRTKKPVRTALYFPIAYSLIMRQLGSYSGLRKCNTNKQSSDSAPLPIITFANVLIILSFDGLTMHLVDPGLV